MSCNHVALSISSSRAFYPTRYKKEIITFRTFNVKEMNCVDNTFLANVLASRTFDIDPTAEAR